MSIYVKLQLKAGLILKWIDILKFLDKSVKPVNHPDKVSG